MVDLQSTATHVPASNVSKAAVRAYWGNEPCGTRALDPTDRAAFFSSLERERYQAEPHIAGFAGFASAAGQRVLEIGVGAGTDFVQWVDHGARAVGVDLTEAGVKLTRERLSIRGRHAPLMVGDAESLPFRSASFDGIYSYGVLHHSPDTEGAIAEVHRVVRPGGWVRIMIYHHPSISSWLLAARYQCSPQRALAYLESPGTKAYSVAQTRRLFSAFSDVTCQVVLGSGDLMLMRPSSKHAHLAWLWRLYPRWFVRRVGRSFGSMVLITCRR
jgi:ubiquinone/menaquinone biosynthesis C-methylase UbiE